MDTTTTLELIANADGPFTSADVCKLAGCTYRQLDYWVRTELVTPCLRLTGTGSGRQREWDLEAVLEVVVIARLARAGVDITVLRDANIIEVATQLIADLNDVLELIGILDDDNRHHRRLVAV